MSTTEKGFPKLNIVYIRGGSESRLKLLTLYIHCAIKMCWKDISWLKWNLRLLGRSRINQTLIDALKKTIQLLRQLK